MAAKKSKRRGALQLSDEQLDRGAHHIMDLPGVTRRHGSFVMVEQNGSTVFMKFMSDGGRTDTRNGYAMMRYLAENETPFRTMDDTLDDGNEHQMRKLDMRAKDFKHLFV